jgi:hypothetical protein
MYRLSYLLLFSLLVLISCKDGKKTESMQIEKYEQSKLSVEEAEKENPMKFLSVTSTDKKNIIGQKVIKGTVHNNAKIASFKDIDIKISFFSKTGELLEEDHEFIYEGIPPGGSVNFKSKFFAAKGSDSVSLEIVEAKISQ